MLLEFFYHVLGKSAGSTLRVGHVMRPMSPRSPTASVFESMEGSDEEDNMTDSCIVDSPYLYTNEDTVRFVIILVFFLFI